MPNQVKILKRKNTNIEEDFEDFEDFPDIPDEDVNRQSIHEESY